MTRQYPDFFPRRINQYVPAMSYAVDVSMNAPTRVNFGTPAAADTDGAIDDGTIGTSAVTLTDFSSGAIGDTADATYGRNVSVEGTTGGDDATVTVYGRDYWGQPMAEEFTLSGTSTQTGSKAFYTLDRVEVGANTQSSTIDVGWGGELGLPYKTQLVHAEITDGTVESSVGTLTAPVLTDPQTATTGDPRGTYDPNATPDGSTEIEAFVIADNAVNDDGNGGLLGIKHFYS